MRAALVTLSLTLARPPAKSVKALAANSPAEATFRVVSSLSDIAREDWDACANPPGVGYNPFLSHDFLWSLEESGSATRKTGWLGQHLVLDGADGRPAAVMPCYLKCHSQGEYVFDHGWADAYERAGGRYYPKLQASVPFTPVTGRRLLVAPGDDAERNRGPARRQPAPRWPPSLASPRCTSPSRRRTEQAVLAEAGYLPRNDQQFHFVNEGYGDFDDFLSALASRKRKAIRRERRDALAGGIEVVHLTGSDLTEDAWDAFFAFYMDTGSRKWGRPYLNRRFFSLIGERMADRILLMLAMRERPADRRRAQLHRLRHALRPLLGRRRGRSRSCISSSATIRPSTGASPTGSRCVEAGAQGEHKLARGYRPITTHSAHWIADPGFRSAVADYLKRERRRCRPQIRRTLAEYLPFRENV